MSTTIATVSQQFFEWADRSLSQPMPEATVAFHFNLYEGETSVHVQLMGTASFHAGEVPERDYWPGTETFTTGEEIFEIPFSVAGSEWQEWVTTSKTMIAEYIANGARSKVLRSSLGVGIGFVDGDMHVLWQKGDA
ncbi:hypothetical protein [Methylomonas sp. 11b]|uniref:hypothetical protein n=1 Tax=Methylomonas sp. 11b TaxID=1168169 RepID=UPI00047E3D03|nr:hypothetical protein [Methylomonas sp. 11b]